MDLSLDIVVRVIETSTIVLAGGTVIYRLGRAVEKFERIGAQQAVEITELKKSVTKITDIVQAQALQTQRADIFADRLNRFEKKVDELAHGEGFIFPLSRMPTKS